MKKIHIKLEIDRNPPSGSAFQTSYITFPNTAAITTQSLACGFATKAHALLCRRYVKGRDWYDFVWYVSRKTKPDLQLLKNALVQRGPWAGQAINMSVDWFVNQMISIVREIDWQAAAEAVRRFVPDREQQGLHRWSTDFFLFQVQNMKSYLQAEQ